jgi:prephenate dehydrogenase
MRVTELPPDEHDRLVSDISHLPHLLAAALVSMQEDAALQLAGKGFLDVTRVAAGDAGLWRDILMDNHDHVSQSVEQFCTLMINLLKLIQPAKAAELTKWLESASKRRERLLQQKLREINPD